MDRFAFRRDYWQDPAARSAFCAFLRRIHGLDLSSWRAAGWWDDDDYHPFSLFDDRGRVVASVCVYSMNLVLDGSPCRAAQLSGVGTLPELRRQGLNRRLTELALQWAAADHDFVFLFANEGALPFYARCGFRALTESQPVLATEGRASVGRRRRLDLTQADDKPLIERLAFGRVPVSQRLGVHNPRLLLFHLLHGLGEAIHFLPELDLLVLMQHRGPLLTLFDLIGERIPEWEELYPLIARSQTSEVRFCFEPDLLHLAEVQRRPLTAHHLHDRGDSPLRGQPLIIPWTAHA